MQFDPPSSGIRVQYKVLQCPVQTAAAADEVVPVVPPADPPQRAHLPAVQGQEPLAQPQEAEEEIVAHDPLVCSVRLTLPARLCIKFD